MALEQSIVMGIALAYLFARMLTESEQEEQRAERYDPLSAVSALEDGAVLDARGPLDLDRPAADDALAEGDVAAHVSRSQPTSDGGPAGGGRRSRGRA